MSVIVRALTNDNPAQTLVQSNPEIQNSHTVAFYDDESVLIEALTESVYLSIQAGNSALVIATPEHHDGLFDSIQGRNTAFHSAILEGRLFLLDAAETLSRFMIDDEPDPELFARIMGNYLRLLSNSARGKDNHVFAFGEMVAVLWEQGNPAAALRVEEIWNQIVANYSFNLCCAYPLRLFPDMRAAENSIFRQEYSTHPSLSSLRLSNRAPVNA